jgi:hypothetical protein
MKFALAIAALLLAALPAHPGKFTSASCTASTFAGVTRPSVAIRASAVAGPLSLENKNTMQSS